MLPKEVNCPQCDAYLELDNEERISQIVACPICEEKFDLSDPQNNKKLIQTDSEGLTTVHIPQNDLEHQTVVSILEDAGIECYSLNEGAQNIFGSGVAAPGYILSGPIKIQVANKDIEKATRILDNQTYIAGEEESVKIPEICPACSAKTENQYKCVNCGLVFVPIENEPETELDKEFDIAKKVRSYAIRSIAWSLFFGIGAIIGIYYGNKALRLISESGQEVEGKGLATAGIIIGWLVLILIAIRMFFLYVY